MLSSLGLFIFYSTSFIISKAFQGGNISFAVIEPAVEFTINGIQDVADQQKPLKQLQKDLTRKAGGSLTNKSVDKVMTAVKRTCHEGGKHYGHLCTTSQHESRQGSDNTQLQCLLMRSSQCL